jgi:hypothetical protein
MPLERLSPRSLSGVALVRVINRQSNAIAGRATKIKRPPKIFRIKKQTFPQLVIASEFAADLLLSPTKKLRLFKQRQLDNSFRIKVRFTERGYRYLEKEEALALAKFDKQKTGWHSKQAQKPGILLDSAKKRN